MNSDPRKEALSRPLRPDSVPSLQLSLERLSFAYHPGHEVIRDISLELEPGLFHGILGPNGCGKSTLIDLICGHLRPRRGGIRLSGRRLEEFSKRQLARQIALVPQFYNVNFPYTAREIVMMGRYPHLPRFAAASPREEALVNETMALTGTLELAERPITELSGGERQRVVFARALVQQTPLLLLDEATANLDINHTLNLLVLVRERILREGLTVIAVFQDLNLAAAFCDRLLLLYRGQIEKAGRVEEVLTPAALQRVFGIEARLFEDPFFGHRQIACRIPE